MTVLWLGWLLAAQVSGGYRIAGMVVNAASGQPVSGARVTVVPREQRDRQVSAVTDETGRFAFAELPPGKYELTGQRRGLLAASWPGAIVTGPGRDTENIVLRLPPPAIISGKVVDDAGEPVGQALVDLFGFRIVDGRRQLIKDAFKRTDDTGEYRFSALPPGTYFLVVSGVPWYTKFNETHGDEAPRAMTHAGYGIRYYPNAADPAAAEPLVLKAGQEAAANFTLLPVPAVSVYVHCEQDESLTKQYTLTTGGLLGKPVNVRQGSEAGDLYNLWGVLPGHYALRAEATDGSHTWYGATELDIAGSDADVDVTLRDAPSLNGLVVPEGGAGLPAHLTVLLRDESGRSVAVAMGADGRFSIPAIPPGRYRVRIAGADEYYLRREDDILDIQPGAPVRLSLPISRGAGRIAGTVDREGQPLPGALVVLTPGNRAVVSNSDGSFEFRGLPAGEYTLFAVDDGAGLEYANPAVIRPYLAQAKKIQIPPDVAHLLLHAAPAPPGMSQLK
jgi:carboxypeptidase family protein